SLPKGHRGEMGERGLVVADAVHDGEMAVFVEPLEPGHGRLEAEMLIELAQPLRLDADARSGAVIGVISIGHDRVEPVIAAGKLNHHQDAALLGRGRGLRPERRALEIAGGAQRKAAKVQAQKIAAGDATKLGRTSGRAWGTASHDRASKSLR